MLPFLKELGIVALGDPSWVVLVRFSDRIILCSGGIHRCYIIGADVRPDWRVQGT
jgi:hypothetical protein